MEPILKFPFGAASTATLTATGAQAITIANNLTIIDGVTTHGTGNRTLNLTIDSEIKAGAEILLLTKTNGTETTVGGTGIAKSALLTGVAGKTFAQVLVYNGTSFYQVAAPSQQD
jgi:hypothetical protein